jgi:hypothetical protein
MANPQKGEWYLGAKCPKCGEMVVHAPDPTRGKGDKKTGDTNVALTCPKGHTFDLVTQNLLRFEWGAQ